MNYLAHAFLSGHDENLLIGNFIADHVRGSHLHVYSNEIVQGIMMHRHIDTFTDSHPEFRAAKRLFYQGFEKHSGILVDIYFDHFLAAEFHRYASETLKDFSDRIYRVYNAHRHVLPASSTRFLDYLTQNRIYESYAREEGIERVLYHLSQRIRHNVMLHQSLPLLKRHYPQLQAHFKAFFAEAQDLFART